MAMDHIAIDVDGLDHPVIVDPTTIDPDVMREAITRGLTEMFAERFEEAKSNLAARVLADMSVDAPAFRKVA